MAFTLNIDFGGMCLFVAESSANRMSVVLPSMGGTGEHSAHRHVPLLVLDAAHLDLAAIPPALLSGLKVHVPLRHLWFEVPGASPVLTFCPDMADLTTVTTGHKLRAGVLEDGSAPPRELASRIMLKGGKIAGLFPGACWQWGNDVRRVAHRVRWSATLSSGFTLGLKALRAEGAPRDIALRPLPGSDGTITLNIHNSPPGDLPPEHGTPEQPAYNAAAPHFGGYYGLFAGYPPVQVPLFRSVQGCAPKNGTDCTPLADMGGSPYTCMVAGLTV